MTMDILWAISHPANNNLSAPVVNQSFPGGFSVQTPPYADGTREMYEDFVGGVQFWGYGLVSGSGDGAVRMWDSKSMINYNSRCLNYYFLVRTGQAHRTLLGHTGPVTCLQFDEIHIASGSLDKTLKVGLATAVSLHALWLIMLQIWDLRMGGIFDTIQFDHAVTGLQFDTRKIIAATGENGVKVGVTSNNHTRTSCHN